MTDETAFQEALDAGWQDCDTRLIFADWLEEHGDWRAAGYRWMGVNRRYPVRETIARVGSAWVVGNGKHPVAAGMIGSELLDFIGLQRIARHGGGGIYWKTRREADDAICLAVLRRSSVDVIAGLVRKIQSKADVGAMRQLAGVLVLTQDRRASGVSLGVDRLERGIRYSLSGRCRRPHNNIGLWIRDSRRLILKELGKRVTKKPFTFYIDVAVDVARAYRKAKQFAAAVDADAESC